MNKPKHTKGPWRVHFDGDGCHVDFDGGRVFDTTEDTPESDNDIQELKANAHLIAAAPEMYEVIEKVLPILVECMDPKKPVERSAIELLFSNVLKKARGEV